MSSRRGLEKMEASFLDIHSRLTFTTWTRTDALEYDNYMIKRLFIIRTPCQLTLVFSTGMRFNAPRLYAGRLRIDYVKLAIVFM